MEGQSNRQCDLKIQETVSLAIENQKLELHDLYKMTVTVRMNDIIILGLSVQNQATMQTYMYTCSTLQLAKQFASKKDIMVSVVVVEPCICIFQILAFTYHAARSLVVNKLANKFLDQLIDQPSMHV